MRTGHALTVSGGVVGASQKNFLGGKKLKKKEKKFGDPPKIGDHPPPAPQKIGDHTPPNPPKKIGDPPKNWRPPPPGKLETPPDKLETTPPLCGQTHACKNITLAQLRCGR